MSLNKRRILIKSFIILQFNYCSLIWMVHNRAVRIVYDDYSSSFLDLLNKDKSVTIHQRNLQQLVTEIFKVKIGIAPIIMNEIFNLI